MRTFTDRHQLAACHGRSVGAGDPAEKDGAGQDLIRSIFGPDAIAENGSDAEQRAFQELAERFRNEPDEEEAKRLGDELGRTVFGD